MADQVMTERPSDDFTFHPSSSSFAVSLQAYRDAHPDRGFDYIATGAVVFDTADASAPRVLLVQRAASDSMPNRWEVPGGGCDEEDESILHAVARELWEEAGLKTAHIGEPLGEPHLFRSRGGKKIGRFVFVVSAERGSDDRFDVRLDPMEHQRFVWASLDEVKTGRAGDVQLLFTTGDLERRVIQAFEHAGYR